MHLDQSRCLYINFLDPDQNSRKLQFVRRGHLKMQYRKMRDWKVTDYRIWQTKQRAFMSLVQEHICIQFTLKTVPISLGSVRVVNEKERERRAPNARESRRRRRWGGWRLGRGYPLPSGEGDWGRGLCPLPEIFLIFLSDTGAFWCILGVCFNFSIRRVKQSKSSFVCQLSIGQLSHMADVSSMISYK